MFKHTYHSQQQLFDQQIEQIINHYFILTSDIEIISKFAQLEFKHGEPERGRTLFEKLLSTYPKRTDIWSVYIDMMIKIQDTTSVR